MIEKTYFFPKNRFSLKEFLWTRRIKFDNPARNSSRNDQIFLLRAQE